MLEALGALAGAACCGKQDSPQCACARALHGILLFQAVVALKEGTIGEQTATIGEQAAAILQRDRTIADQVATIGEQADAIAQREEAIAVREAAVAEHAAAIADQVATIGEQANTIAELQRQLVSGITQAQHCVWCPARVRVYRCVFRAFHAWVRCVRLVCVGAGCSAVCARVLWFVLCMIPAWVYALPVVVCVPRCVAEWPGCSSPACAGGGGSPS